MPSALGGIVRAGVLSDNDGNPDAAFADLCERYAVLCLQLERADRLRSRAYAREAPQRTGTDTDIPNPITDDWITN